MIWGGGTTPLSSPGIIIWYPVTIVEHGSYYELYQECRADHFGTVIEDRNFDLGAHGVRYTYGNEIVYNALVFPQRLVILRH